MGYNTIRIPKPWVFVFFLAMGAASLAMAQQAPERLAFQALIKDGSGNVINQSSPVLVRAQYMGFVTGVGWCVLSEEGFSSTIPQGHLSLRLGSGVSLSTTGVSVGGFTNVTSEMLIQNSPLTTLSGMLAVLNLNWDTQCRLSDTHLSTGWTNVTSDQTLTGERALRLKIDVSGNPIYLSYPIESNPFALVSKSASTLVGSQGATVGQVLKWDGSAWFPDDDENTTYTANDGLSLSTNVLSVASLGVTTAKLADGAVIADKLATDSVQTIKIANNAVTDTKLATGAVTSSKIADGAVDGSKIADGAVNDSKISGVAWSKVTGTPTTLLGYGITDAVSSSALTGYVQKSGDTMTGALVLPINGLTVGTSQLVVSSGRVGVGTANPATALDVAGSVRVANDATTCASPIAGAIRYTGGSLEYCNGTAWVTISVSVAASIMNNGNTLGADVTLGTNDNYALIFETNNQGRMHLLANGNVGIGTATPGDNTRLSVNGQIATSSGSIVNHSVDFSSGNAITTTADCSSNMTFANLRDGGHYVVVVTDAGTNQCNFDTSVTGDDATTVSYRFAPVNGPRVATKHTIYNLSRVGSTVYVSWVSDF